MCAALWTQKLRVGLPGGSAGDGGRGWERASSTPVRVAAATEEAAAGSGPSLAYGACASPFGVVHLAASAAGIRAVSLYEDEARFRARVGPASWDRAARDTALAQAVVELAEYFAGQRQEFDVALDLCSTSAFDRMVLDGIAAIPFGATRTYGELAAAIGSRGAARAVGRACGRNPVPLLIACHRVVRAGGGLSGFSAGGPDVKARLLALERSALAL